MSESLLCTHRIIEYKNGDQIVMDKCNVLAMVASYARCKIKRILLTFCLLTNCSTRDIRSWITSFLVPSLFLKSSECIF